MTRTARARTPRIATQAVAQQIEHQYAESDAPPAVVAGRVKEILLVDPDAVSLRAAQNALKLVADVDVCSEFQVARARLMARPPDLLVTNLRLQAYNGLHLVHLMAGTPTRCIAYAEYDDLVLVREVLAAGAFYARSNQLLNALEAYVHAMLPPRDRRSPMVLDRRRILRGGRRCTDTFSSEARRFI